MTAQLFWVAAGGAAGSAARFLVQKWVIVRFAPVFPWGTFLVNVAGCFLIGILVGCSFRSDHLTDHMKLFLMTGFCGGFTTFSAFSSESVSLLRDGKFCLFLMYVTGSVLLGFLATFSAIKLFRIF